MAIQSRGTHAIRLHSESLCISQVCSMPEQQHILHMFAADDTVYAISACGDLWKIIENQLTPSPVNALRGISLRMIVCAKDYSLMLGTDGLVMFMGADTDEFGTSGIVQLYQTVAPVLVPGLRYITSIAAAETHAAAIDREGLLYTWGTGKFGQLGGTSWEEYQKPPGIVETAKIFSCNTVAWGRRWTIISTQGGYAYKYGSISERKKESTPTYRMTSPSKCSTMRERRNSATSITGMDQHFVIKADLGEDYAAVLTDTGDVIIFDDSGQLVWPPVQSQVVIKDIQCLPESIIGITFDESKLYFWHPPVFGRKSNLVRVLSKIDETMSSLATWEAEVFEMKSQYKFGGFGIGGMVGISGDIDTSWQFIEKVAWLNAYQRSEAIDLLTTNIHDRGEINLSDPKVFLKALQIRLEYEQEQWLNTLVSLFHAPLSLSFSRIQTYAESMHIYKRTMAATLMPSLLVKMFTKYKNNWFAIAMALLRQHSQLVQIEQKNREHQAQISEQFKIEATKALGRVISSTLKRNWKNAAASLLTAVRNLHVEAMIYTGQIKMLHMRMIKQSRSLCQQAMNKWKDILIRWMITKQGTERFGNFLRSVFMFHRFYTLKSWSQYKARRLLTWGKLLRRNKARQIRDARSSKFSIWKQATMQNQIFVKAKRDICNVVCRSISLRLRKPVRDILRFGFKRVQSYALKKHYLRVMRYPLIFIFQLLQKYCLRMYNHGFNSLIRFRDSNLATTHPTYDFYISPNTMSTTKSIGRALSPVTFDDFDFRSSGENSRTTSYGFIKNLGVTMESFPVSRVRTPEQSFRKQSGFKSSKIQQSIIQYRSKKPGESLPFEIQKRKSPTLINNKSLMNIKIPRIYQTLEEPDHSTMKQPPWKSPNSPSLYKPKPSASRKRGLEYAKQLEARRRQKQSLRAYRSQSPMTPESPVPISPNRPGSPKYPSNIESIFFKRRDKQRATIAIYSILERLKNICLVQGMFRIRSRRMYKIKRPKWGKISCEILVRVLKRKLKEYLYELY